MVLTVLRNFPFVIFPFVAAVFRQVATKRISPRKLLSGFRGETLSDNKRFMCFVGVPGLEPGKTGPESVVLPITPYPNHFESKKPSRLLKRGDYLYSSVVIRLGLEPKTHTLKVYCSTS